MYLQNVGLGAAMSQFEKQFKSKTGYRWDDRAAAHGRPGKYAFLERNYEEDDEENDVQQDDKSDPDEPARELKSRLAKPLQSLMQLIFNTDIMYVTFYFFNPLETSMHRH